MPGFPTASGFPNHSGIHIPTLFGTSLLVEFYITTVLQEICSTEHEGQLKQMGDTLKIPVLPDITNANYVKGMKMEYQSATGSTIDLVIDKGIYWGLNFNALDVKQFNIPYVQKWAEHAARKQKIAIDGAVLGDIYGSASAYNRGVAAGAKSGSLDFGAVGNPFGLSKTNVLDKIVDFGTALDEQEAPDTGRYVVLPPWACGLIKKSDLKDASMTGDGQSTIRNGRLGMIDNFTIYRSNNLTVSTDGSDRVTNIIFGQKHAVTFASQMMITETIPNPDDIGQRMRSVQAYGYLVQKPEALGHFYAKQAA
jgi:hypothetical protein